MNRERYLIYTSVLVRLLAEDDLQHAKVKSVIAKLSIASTLIFTPQVARETWAVLTRPHQANGLGLSPATARTALRFTSQQFEFLADTPAVYDRWLELLEAVDVSGRQVHDAYHVAAMRAHGINRILTLDKRDFARYPDIQVLFPGDV